MSNMHDFVLVFAATILLIGTSQCISTLDKMDRPLLSRILNMNTEDQSSVNNNMMGRLSRSAALEQHKTREAKRIETSVLDSPSGVHLRPIEGSIAMECDPKVCRLPDCFCGGVDTPTDLPITSQPQLVVLTFDDAVNERNAPLYAELFESGRKNPNGCPIAATFFVSHEWNDYRLVRNLYADGHEIASHSISHSHGDQFSSKKWAQEVAGQRDLLLKYAQVRQEDIRGMRAPFLSAGGDNMFRMLHDMNFTYDSSLPVMENKPPYWPYTLDYKINHVCVIPPCATRSFPGVWEVPLVQWVGHNSERCAMADSCSYPTDSNMVKDTLMDNFNRHYESNRSPFPMFFHSTWFTPLHHKEGFLSFLDEILKKDDVFLVTTWQMLQWIRDPTPRNNLYKFKPFQCNYPERPKRCSPGESNICKTNLDSQVRYFHICGPCPTDDIYPWTGNTGIENSHLNSYF